jgi:hypothetical protein
MSTALPGDILYQLAAGFLAAGPGINEMALVSTAPDGDPALFRIGGVTGAAGGWAGDIVAIDPTTGERRHNMVVLVQYKKDERTKGRDDVTYGELTIHLQGPPRFPGDDGMLLVALFLHDYAWIKGISPTPEPVKPWIELPPPVPSPLPPPPPPLITPEERAERVLDVAAMQSEWPGMNLNNVGPYLEGRSSLREFHNDNAERATTHDASKHRPGRPY